MRRDWRIKCKAILFVCLLQACATSHKVPLNNELENAQIQLAIIKENSGNQVKLEQLIDLQRQFSIYADWTSLWQTDLYLALYYYQNSQYDKALNQIEACLNLTKNWKNQEANQRCSLLASRIHSRYQFKLNEILINPATPTLAALAYIYTGQLTQAVTFIEQIPESEHQDLAYLWYLKGKKDRQIKSVEQALYYYQIGGHYRGITDSLFLLAQIARQQNNEDLAQHYAHLAIRSAEQHAPKIVAIIQQWLLTDTL